MENSIQSKEDIDIMIIFEWIDSLPLSKPKKNINRDFSDGMLMAEVIKNYYPSLIELHNYPAANSTTQKKYNWNTLNNKVLKKIGIFLNLNEIDAIISSKPLAIENLLTKFYLKVTSESKILTKVNSFNIINQNPSKESKCHKTEFYQKQIEEKDSIIKQLQSKIVSTESRLKELADEKIKLEQTYREHSFKLK